MATKIGKRGLDIKGDTEVGGPEEAIQRAGRASTKEVRRVRCDFQRTTGGQTENGASGGRKHRGVTGSRQDQGGLGSHNVLVTPSEGKTGPPNQGGPVPIFSG